MPTGMWVCRIRRERNLAAMASNATIASRWPPTSGSNAIAVGRQCAAMASNATIAPRCLHGRRYAEFVGNEIWPQWRQMLRSLRVGHPQAKYTTLGHQCAHRDVGMPNSSGTKFGRNGVKCYDRFSLATHKRNIQLWDVNVPTSTCLQITVLKWKHSYLNGVKLKN